MRLYNTLGRKIETFTPQNSEHVSLYTCGPTVYDFAHIGNLRKFIFDDTLRRTLELNNYKVKHVMNITDVGHLVSDADEGEDKLEKGAAREGKSVWDVANDYTQAFKNDMDLLNILRPNAYSEKPDGYARATDFIAQQIEMVHLLIDKGYAYQTKQAIYFNVTKLASYGELTGQKLADKEVAVRAEVVADPDKKHPYDFAVWFFTVSKFEGHSMHWESPWGDGFPGWHLECSAIIHSTLGEPIDIHTGGIDHIGTHHTNEMAQTEAAFGKKLAKFWLHSDFIQVDGAKMSKSKNNFYVLKDILDKKYSSLAYRLLVLQAHYRSELNFTWDSLEAANNRLKGYKAMADHQWQTSTDEFISPQLIETTQQVILDALQNDLNTPIALERLSQFESAVSVHGISQESSARFVAFLQWLDSALGLDLTSGHDLPDNAKELLMQRETARQDKNWNEADKLRDDLLAQDIEVRDTSHGQVWSRG